MSTSQLAGSTRDWVTAGRAWGARSADWAYLFEPYSRPANELLLDQLGVSSGTRLIDLACGSGFAAQLAGARGAEVAGIDASESLVTIARARTPQGDFRVGDMFDLPFADGRFDVATSFNGIWKGCEGALREARRVLAPGGRFGMTFWGRLERIGLMPYFAKIIELSPRSHGEATLHQGDTGRSGVVEEMLTSTGFTLRQRGTVEVTNEWPDVDTAVRALVAAGPAIPAIENVGVDVFRDALTAVLAPMHSPETGVRVTSELGWITADAR